jgi:hypothetical protein
MSMIMFMAMGMAIAIALHRLGCAFRVGRLFAGLLAWHRCRFLGFFRSHASSFKLQFKVDPTLKTPAVELTPGFLFLSLLFPCFLLVLQHSRDRRATPATWWTILSKLQAFSVGAQEGAELEKDQSRVGVRMRLREARVTALRWVSAPGTFPAAPG